VGGNQRGNRMPSIESGRVKIDPQLPELHEVRTPLCDLFVLG
jgi:hypothetical protein